MEKIKQFDNIDKICIFGAGELGINLKNILNIFGMFGCYIDNDKNKQNESPDNKVINFKEYMNGRKNNFIVIAASLQNIEVISNQLEQNGLKKRIDYCDINCFLKEMFPTIVFYKYNKLYTNLVQITLTERCTLKCEKCAHACWNVNNYSVDMSLNDAKKSADYFFSMFDLVNEFVLIGGEPFLYENLKEIIKYIGEKYRKKMIVFSLTTNGTIIPDDEVVELFDKYNMTLRVSDYSVTLPGLKEKYKKLYEKFDGKDVRVWKTNDTNAWFDYGFGEFNRNNNINDLKNAFRKCRTECREIREYKYYYCVMARSVSDNMNLNIGKDDYIDLRNVIDRKEILEFELGNIKKEYLDMCNYCRGSEAKNFLIPAAKQRRNV